MPIHSFFKTHTREALLFVVQCIVLIVCVLFIRSIYLNQIAADELVEEKFNETICTINNKQLTEDTTQKAYRADILVSYMVNNVSYQQSVPANGLDQSFKKDRASEQKLFDQYKIGETSSCWYDPAAPQIVVLALKHEWFSTLPLFFPIIIAFIMIYYMIKSLLSFIMRSKNPSK